jgi:hypothetical protein
MESPSSSASSSRSNSLDSSIDSSIDASPSPSRLEYTREFLLSMRDAPSAKVKPDLLPENLDFVCPLGQSLSRKNSAAALELNRQKPRANSNPWRLVSNASHPKVRRPRPRHTSEQSTDGRKC